MVAVLNNHYIPFLSGKSRGIKLYEKIPENASKSLDKSEIKPIKEYPLTVKEENEKIPPDFVLFDLLA